MVFTEIDHASAASKNAGTREFVELCRSHSDKAVKALLEALERPRDAVAAANTLLAYGTCQRL
jgi:hypothetical protein